MPIPRVIWTTPAGAPSLGLAQHRCRGEVVKRSMASTSCTPGGCRVRCLLTSGLTGWLRASWDPKMGLRQFCSSFTHARHLLLLHSHVLGWLPLLLLNSILSFNNICMSVLSTHNTGPSTPLARTTRTNSYMFSAPLRQSPVLPHASVSSDIRYMDIPMEMSQPHL